MTKINFKILFLLFISSISIPFLCFLNLKTSNATYLKQINYQKQLEVTGIIESEKSTPLSLSYPIYIKECYVTENSYVNKGQLLFVLDMDEMQEAVKNYNLSNIQYSNTNMSRNEILNISSEIYAPESGFVHDITAYSGNIVMADEALCVIDKSDELILKITLDQHDYSKIQVGDKIIFSPTIAPAREYSGTITDKTAVVRKETSIAGSKTVVDIFADIDYSDDYLTHGLQFTGSVFNQENRTILTLPYEYINQDSNGEYVNVFSDGLIIKKYIETGIEMENNVEIKTTLPLNTVFVKNDTKGKLLIEHFD